MKEYGWLGFQLYLLGSDPLLFPPHQAACLQDDQVGTVFSPILNEDLSSPLHRAASQLFGESTR